jgi:hypothetical protein
VVLDSPRADEQLRADLGVRVAFARKLGDLGLLRSELTACVCCALTRRSPTAPRSSQPNLCKRSASIALPNGAVACRISASRHRFIGFSSHFSGSTRHTLTTRRSFASRRSPVRSRYAPSRSDRLPRGVYFHGLVGQTHGRDRLSSVRRLGTRTSSVLSPLRRSHDPGFADGGAQDRDHSLR